MRWVGLGMILALVTASACAAATVEPARRYYVAPDGNDRNAGTENKPFATIQRARDAIRELTKAAALPVGGVEVLLRGGTYRLKEPLTFGPEDSGRPDAPIVYAAWGSQLPVLSGGVSLDGWRQPKPGVW